MEARRLLTYTILGTPGDDAILVQPGGGGYTVMLNGTQVASSPDTSVILSSLGGHDTVVITNVLFGSSITVRGGLGDDLVEVGDGRLFSSLNGHVYLQEFAGEGDDRFVANDIFDTFPDRPVRVRDNLLTSGTGSLVGAHYDDNVEHKSLLCSSAADTVYVESPAAGMSISLGDGDDTVEFGSYTANDLPDFMAPGTIGGGAGFDRMIFDDSGGLFTEPRDYVIDPTRLENQMLTGVEDAELLVRGSYSYDNVVRVTGRGSADGLLNRITISGESNELLIGSEVARIDAGAMSLTLDVAMGHGSIEIHDTKDALLVSPWEIFTTFAGQVVRRGFFAIIARDADEALIRIDAGPTDDQFAVGHTVPGSVFALYGNGGNDSVYTTDANFQDNDLDEIFMGSQFSFHGGTGQDFMDLDDTGDETGDGDEIYHLLGDALDKGAGELVTWGAANGNPDDVEHVRLATGADDNTIYFRGPRRFGTDVAYTIDAGAGNDYITNYIAAFEGGDLSWSRHDATIVGGAGADTLAIDDTASVASTRHYRFESGYRLVAPSSMTYDPLIETLSLEANEGSGTIRIDAKPTNTVLTVNGRGGNETFTVGGGDIDASGFSLSTTSFQGGAGDDRIVFDDSADDHGPSDNDEFAFFIQQVIKDGVGISYGGFDSQKLITSGVNSSGVAAPNKVRIHATNIPTEVEGAAGVRDNTVDVGNDGAGLSLISAPITLLFDNAPVVASVFDQSGVAARSYAFSATQMSLPVVVNYVGVEDLYVYAGSGNDTLNVSGTPAGMNVFFNGGNGDETMSLGSSAGPLAALAGRVFANGGNGNDGLYITNGAGGGFTDGVLTSGSFLANGGPNHLYSGIEGLQVTLNGDGSSINMTSVSVATGVQGGGGNDAVTVGGGDFHNNILAHVFVRGEGGIDRVVIDDRSGTSPPPGLLGYRFDIFVGTLGPVDRFNPNPVTVGFQVGSLGVEQREFHGSNLANTIDVLDSLSDLRINSNGGNDTIAVTDATGLVTLDTGAGSDAVTINADSGTPGDGPLTVLFDRSDDVHALDLRAGGTLRIGAGATVLKTTGSNSGLSLQGVLDLAGGSMLFRAAANVPNPAALRAMITTGRNGGAWNGTSSSGAINSSLAAGSPLSDGVGYGLGSQIAPTTIGAFTIAANDTLIRYTLDGDTNLDGRVNLQDFNRLASNFGQTSRQWVHGDTNYDGTVNLVDFNLLATNFGRAVAGS